MSMYRASKTGKLCLAIFFLIASIQGIFDAGPVLADAGPALVKGLTKGLEIPPPPKIQLMPGAQSSWIAPRMLQNGIPMSILQFTHPGSAADIELYYKAYRANKPINIEHWENETLIAYEENGYFYSIHTQHNGNYNRPGIHGKIVANKLVDTVSPPNTELPLMPGSHIISKTNAVDNNTDSETLMLSNHHSKEANYRYLDQHLQQQGWTKNSETAAADAATSHQLLYEMNNQSLQVTVFPLQEITDGRTGVLIHWLK